MPLNPGNETITFTHVTLTGTPDQYGVITPTDTSSAITGCSLDPVSQKDNISDTVYSEATNVCITPANTFTLTLRAEDFLTDIDGVKYRIMGVRRYKDLLGRTDHLTFLCKYEDG